MTEAEWLNKVEYYVKKTQEIRISDQITGQDIRMVVAKMDEVLNDAFFDLSQLQYEYESENASYQTKLSEYFIIGKESPDAKMSDEKAKCYAKKRIADEGIQNKRLEAERRSTFMENLIKLLQEKRQLLVISYGTVKMESDLSGAA